MENNDTIENNCYTYIIFKIWFSAAQTSITDDFVCENLPFYKMTCTSADQNKAKMFWNMILDDLDDLSQLL